MVLWGEKYVLYIYSVEIYISLAFLSVKCNISVGWLRGFIADYGVPFMILVWTAVSYIPVNDVPRGIPRRLFSPNPWSPGAYSNWTVIKVVILAIVCKIFHKAFLCILMLFSCAGDDDCSSIIYCWSIYTSNYDCCALLLWS